MDTQVVHDNLSVEPSVDPWSSAKVNEKMKIIKIILILYFVEYHAKSALPIFNVYQGCFYS